MAIGPPHIYFSKGLENGISQDVLFAAIEQARIVQSRGLPPILTLRHLTELTGVQYKYLREVVGRHRKPYKVFAISKHSGGKRIICVPEPSLMRVQRWINRNVLSKVQPHWRSFAYKSDSSIVCCAREHCGCHWLLKLDIQRFFESISEVKVYKVFQNLGYQPLIAFEIARICTRQAFYHDQLEEASKWTSDPDQYQSIPYYHSYILGHLPQGAPTSPSLANLVSWQLDEDLNRLALEEALVYTRYADDLTFSTIDPKFNRLRARRFVYKVYQVIKQHEFQPNHAKTIIVPPGARKVVLGLLVDRDKPRLPRDLRHRLEQHVRGIKQFGLAEHTAYVGFKSKWGFLRHLEGLIAFANMVEPDFASNIAQSFEETLKEQGWDRTEI